MKYKCSVFLIFSLSIAVTALAQTPSQSGNRDIVGTGKIGFLAAFAGQQTIGDSKVFEAPDGSIGIGTTTPVWPLHVYSTRTVGSGGYPPIAIWAESTASNTWGGVYAVASSPTGNTIAVNGEASSVSGIGVLGQGGLDGVLGSTSSTNTFAVGVFGVSAATSGSGSVGVFGQAWSADATAGLFANVAAGNIIVGGIGQPEVNVFRVDGTGRVYADGGFQPNGADFAESMAVAGDRGQYEAGDLLVIDPTANRRVALSQQPYSTLVAGIYSTKPGMLGSTRRVDDAAPRDEVPLGVVGIVPCKVTTENGSIHVGDLLVTSSNPGYAMKGTDRNRMLGAVVGKALEPLPQGTGVIQVLVTLQ